MACVVQIGAGGVGGVVAHKMAMNRDVFPNIVLASRTISKCNVIAESIRAKGLGEIIVDFVDADNIDSIIRLIEKYKPKLIINVALPYQDLTIMEACLQKGVCYLDTANYEHPDSAHFEYKEQWAYDTRFKMAGLFALLGSGFDPGVTNVFCAYAQKHYFDEIDSIDILDCNAGDHGYAFATNFNPEINLREVSSRARYWTKQCEKWQSNFWIICCSKMESENKNWLWKYLKNTENKQNIEAIKNGDMILWYMTDEEKFSGIFQIENENSKDNFGNLEFKLIQHIDIAKSDIECVDIAEAYNEEYALFTKQYISKTNQSFSPCKTLFKINKHQFEKIIALDPGAIVSYIDLALNPDLKQDTIYRKFERREQHWRFEVEKKEQNRISNKESQEQNSEIFSEKKQIFKSDSCSSTEIKYCGGQWKDVAPLALMKEWDYIGVGVKNSYLLYHEELESLVRNIKGLRRIRFFMTFGESYLTHMKCLENIGLLRIDEVNHKGNKIVPIEVLKTLLPDPASLASCTKGQTHIGCYIKGKKNGKERTIYIYNICDHEACYKEVNSQGVSYTTGVPAMIGAKLIMEGKWGINQPKLSNNIDNSDMPKGGEYQGIDSHNGAGVFNMEQNDPDPFMRELNRQGLPYIVVEIESSDNAKVLEDGRQ